MICGHCSPAALPVPDCTCMSTLLSENVLQIYGDAFSKVQLSYGFRRHGLAYLAKKTQDTGGDKLNITSQTGFYTPSPPPVTDR